MAGTLDGEPVKHIARYVLVINIRRDDETELRDRVSQYLRPPHCASLVNTAAVCTSASGIMKVIKLGVWQFQCLGKERWVVWGKGFVTSTWVSHQPMTGEV